MAPPPAPSKLSKIGPGLKLLGGLAAVALIAIGYYFLFYSDLSNAVNAARERNDQLRQEEASAAQAYKVYVDDTTKLEEKKARARDFNKMLPESSEMASFLANINQQAEIAGLKVRTVVPTDEQNQQFYARVPVRLEFTGKFHQVAKFVAGVGRLDRIINVENIELGSPKVGDNDETTLQARCLTTTFHALPKPAAAPAAAPGAAPPPPGGPK